MSDIALCTCKWNENILQSSNKNDYIKVINFNFFHLSYLNTKYVSSLADMGNKPQSLMKFDRKENMSIYAETIEELTTLVRQSGRHQVLLYRHFRGQ